MAQISILTIFTFILKIIFTFELQVPTVASVLSSVYCVCGVHMFDLCSLPLGFFTPPYNMAIGGLDIPNCPWM